MRQSRGAEADVVAHIGEVERRRLHVREACSSMFEYLSGIARLAPHLTCENAHTFMAEQDYGEDVVSRFRAATSPVAVPVDAYGARIVVRPREISSG